MTTSQPLLAVRDLHAHYGKSHILHGVTLDVGRNEVVSLLGRNGSGRSTTLKSIIGLVTPTRGSIALGGRELAQLRPYEICRAGIAYVPEEREVFANLTVDENLHMGEQRGYPGAPTWTLERACRNSGRSGRRPAVPSGPRAGPRSRPGGRSCRGLKRGRRRRTKPRATRPRCYADRSSPRPLLIDLAGDPPDFALDEALAERRQVAVQPVLEQRPQAVLDHVLERAGRDPAQAGDRLGRSVSRGLRHQHVEIGHRRTHRHRLFRSEVGQFENRLRLRLGFRFRLGFRLRQRDRLGLGFRLGGRRWRRRLDLGRRWRWRRRCGGGRRSRWRWRRRSRRRRLRRFLAGLTPIFGNNPPNGGENFLHRRFSGSGFRISHLSNPGVVSSYSRAARNTSTILSGALRNPGSDLQPGLSGPTPAARTRPDRCRSSARAYRCSSASDRKSRPAGPVRQPRAGPRPRRAGSWRQSRRAGRRRG